VRLIEMAAPLHDMGKIAIPDAVLLKQGKLNEEELAIMRRHPRIGHELLSGSQNRFIQVARLSHCAITSATTAAIPMAWWARHPAGSARIVAVADVFDALISPRPYKEAWTMEATLAASTPSVAACSTRAAWMRCCAARERWTRSAPHSTASRDRVRDMTARSPAAAAPASAGTASTARRSCASC
jgi:hypothetical protein